MTNQQKKRLEEIRERLLLHKGHAIQYVSNAHRQNFGHLQRITIDEDVCSLKLWMKQIARDVPFVSQNPIEGQEFFYIYLDQWADCKTCSEAKPVSNEEVRTVKVRGRS